jgi:hypothetical protein
MSTTPNKLAPTVVRGAKAATTQAQQDGRKRPIVAINEEGKLVVCCRRTAKKNGWQIQDVLYERAAKKAAPEPVKAAAKKAPQRRKTDVEGVVAVPKDKVKAAKEAVDSTLDEILGK